MEKMNTTQKRRIVFFSCIQLNLARWVLPTYENQGNGTCIFKGMAWIFKQNGISLPEPKISKFDIYSLNQHVTNAKLLCYKY
jgi:hypothetical protein